MDSKKLDCPTQKIPFDTKTEAKKYVKHARTQQVFRSKYLSGPKNNRKLRAYQCPFCGKWHLTTRKPRKGYDKTRKK